jgi:hypothetical protein
VEFGPRAMRAVAAEGSHSQDRGAMRKHWRWLFCRSSL